MTRPNPGRLMAAAVQSAVTMVRLITLPTALRRLTRRDFSAKNEQSVRGCGVFPGERWELGPSGVSDTLRAS
jgi:hypothetical protein